MAKKLAGETDKEFFARFWRRFKPETPGLPTLDAAAKDRDITDRLRRRRGLLANLFGGMQRNTQPTVGLKTLTGE